MMKRKTGGPDTPVIIALVAGLVALALAVGFWVWRSGTVQEKRETATAPSVVAASTLPSPDAPLAPKPESVIRYGEPDPDFQELMRRRKAEFGLENGVDMIVREDETLKIGDVAVPMSEIMERIRIEKGGVVESDLSTASRYVNRQSQIEELFSRLKTAEDRFRELDGRLAGTAGPDVQGDGTGLAPEAISIEELRAEHDQLAEIMEDFQVYRQTLREIHEKETLLAAPDLKTAVKTQMEHLQAERTKQAAALESLPLGPGGDSSPGAITGAMERVGVRLRQVETELKAPATDDAARATVLAERASLKEAIGLHAAIRESDARITEYERLLNGDAEILRTDLGRRLSALRQERDDLENSLIARVMPEERVDVFGVYVVRPGDNIWNIHFQFLKEYFNRRGITLSAKSDEPLQPGVSSGVGKILKFSENMVYIYNLRDRRLSFDLDLIHPLSKIVIFNMGQVFQMLDQINYENIRSIRYDGQNLWIPAP